tara:strand:+ start:808 stop:978 length:171 start_codon:yes stop_codon:yes gene_type:complete
MTLSGEKYISYFSNRSNTASWYVVQIQRHKHRYQKAFSDLSEAIIVRDKILQLHIT